MSYKKRRKNTTTKSRKSGYGLWYYVKKIFKIGKLKLKTRTLREIEVVFLITLALVMLLSLLDKAGIFGVYFNNITSSLFGWGAFLVPVALIALAFSILFLPTFKPTFAKVFGTLIFLLASLGLIHLMVPMDSILDAAEKGQYGGYTGFTISMLFRRYLGDQAAAVILVALLVIGLLITFELSLKKIINIFRWFFQLPPPEEIRVPVSKPQEFKTKKIVKTDAEKQVEDKRLERREDMIIDVKAISAKEPGFFKKDIKIVPNAEEKFAAAIKKKGADNNYDEWQYPALDLLNPIPPKMAQDSKDIERNKEIIRSCLVEFNILLPEEMGDFVIEHNHGPTVTQYAFTPPAGIKLNKITSLSNDLALALAAESIRLEAPIPGKAQVGIEVPNRKREDVFLREMLESQEFKSIDSPLRVSLGKNVSGKPIVGDLTKMPHVLIAGATGSGKSVGMNTMLLSLLYFNSPADLKMILVDPKRVELNAYNNIPHLLTPVIVEPEKTVTALRWAVSEMTRRYKVLEEGKEKNIADFNRQFPDQKLPYIIIVIDELADMMMVAAKEVEASVCRIAQLARAVGIHLIVATQRPSVDVITGLIKANIPCRIAYTVTSGVDSKTILDSYGAEKLLGRGDSLYLNGNAPKPVRLQGVYVSHDEIKRVTNEIKLTQEPDYDEDIVERKHEIPQGLPGAGTMGVLQEDSFDDDLVNEAIEVIRETGKASASLFQRRLRVGYARAARLLDILEEQGVVGPVNGAKPREILISREN